MRHERMRTRFFYRIHALTLILSACLAVNLTIPYFLYRASLNAADAGTLLASLPLALIGGAFATFFAMVFLGTWPITLVCNLTWSQLAHNNLITPKKLKTYCQLSAALSILVVIGLVSLISAMVTGQSLGVIAPWTLGSIALSLPSMIIAASLHLRLLKCYGVERLHA